MTSITMTNAEKCKRILDSIEARDTSAMGYQAKLRHNERIAQAQQAFQESLIVDRSNQPASNPAQVNS